MGSISWPRLVIIGTDRPGAGFTFRLIVEWDRPKSTRPVKSVVVAGQKAQETHEHLRLEDQPALGCARVGLPWG
jgi:hypothetical protein